ncbi:aldo/keto reductase [Neosynechococcus sphagnicola sy1]|uniref:Aldo/keto reductase n=2 Tax=Neosynechococcus TaxID=1501143 RepID=A0A098TQ16_9CYAN|nr:aldo/keto reductase [Neosynechococcus sphagnicola]KGF73967.1 aldo/keto reductase [Neosynechococcus sphagnicola sy1]
MQYRRFGRTELSMPVFSCGGMRYQFKWQRVPLAEIPEACQRNLEATINRAVELGITHIETARGYGTSELQLGQILPKLPRNQLIVQTKVTPQGQPQEFRQAIEQSLETLGLDFIDLLGLHGINTDEILDHCLRPDGYLEVAQHLRAAGKVRFIGFSTHGSTETIVRAIATHQFDYVNLHWYYINQQNWPAIAAATAADMGVFIISPTNKGGLLDQPSQKLMDLCAPLSPIQFNDLFCLSHPQVHTLSVGAACPGDFDDHLKILGLLPQASEILPPILHRLQQAACESLGEEWYKTWQVGLPSATETPQGINIPVILWLWNLATAYDLVDYAKMRYNLLSNGSHWFPGAQAEGVETLDLAPCLAHSPHGAKIPAILAAAHQLLGNQTVKRLSES